MSVIEGRMYKDGLPVTGGECPTNKGREGRGRGEDCCILGRQRKDSRCSGYAGPAFIPISDGNTQFSFLGITPPLSTLSSSLGVANLIPCLGASHDRVGPIRTPYSLAGDWLRDGHIIRSRQSGPRRLNSICWDHTDLKLIDKA